jgi:hypothetical protein
LLVVFETIMLSVLPSTPQRIWQTFGSAPVQASWTVTHKFFRNHHHPERRHAAVAAAAAAGAAAAARMLRILRSMSGTQRTMKARSTVTRAVLNPFTVILSAGCLSLAVAGAPPTEPANALVLFYDAAAAPALTLVG